MANTRPGELCATDVSGAAHLNRRVFRQNKIVMGADLPGGQMGFVVGGMGVSHNRHFITLAGGAECGAVDAEI